MLHLPEARRCRGKQTGNRVEGRVKQGANKGQTTAAFSRQLAHDGSGFRARAIGNSSRQRRTLCSLYGMNSRNLVIRLSREALAALHKLAARENTTVSRLIRRSIAALLNWSEEDLTESTTGGRPRKAERTKPKR